MKLSPTIIFLIDELEVWGGTETHLLRLLRQIQLSHCQAIVGVVGKSRLAPDFQVEGIPVLPLDIYRTFALSGLIGIGKIAHVLRREHASLLVTYHTAADLLGPLAARAVGIPVLSCRRDDGFTKKQIHLKMQHYCNYLLTGMIAVSHAVARVIHASESFSLKKIRVIWNGEDLAHFSPGPSTIRQELDVDDSICLMTCVGSLTPVKDHVTQLKAFARLTPQYPNARLILVGDGPERSQLKELSTKLKLTEKVHFLGHRTDIANILRGSDLYLQSSTTEGFSNAIVQAMAVGLPVVATDVGGNPELVSQDGGILIPPRNPEQLANALLRMVNDKGLRSIMGRQARERVEQHCSIDTMVSSYLTAFEQAIENRY